MTFQHMAQTPCPLPQCKIKFLGQRQRKQSFTSVLYLPPCTVLFNNLFMDLGFLRTSTNCSMKRPVFSLAWDKESTFLLGELDLLLLTNWFHGTLRKSTVSDEGDRVFLKIVCRYASLQIPQNDRARVRVASRPPKNL